jgi:hypothetical protein
VRIIKRRKPSICDDGQAEAQPETARPVSVKDYYVIVVVTSQLL